MKRYMLFAGDLYYPNGGMKDYKGSFDFIEDALGAAHTQIEEEFMDFAHVYDKETGNITHVKEIENWS